MALVPTWLAYTGSDLYTYSVAKSFCAAHSGKLCALEQYCPNGQGALSTSIAGSPLEQTSGEKWAPHSGADNSWVMTGSARDHPTCKDHNPEHGPPVWGITGVVIPPATTYGSTMCCAIPQYGLQVQPPAAPPPVTPPPPPPLSASAPPSPPPPLQPPASKPPPKPLTGPQLQVVNGGCNDELSGFTAQDVDTVFKHQATEAWRKEAIDRQKLPSLHKKNYYIAACLHQSAAILGQWTTEMVKLLLALAKDENMDNLFVSVYQSGSIDATPDILQRFSEALDSMGVRSHIKLGTEVRGTRDRIEFLAAVRNKAMDPIFGITDMKFDDVIWFSDNLFCASGPMQQAVLTSEPEAGGSGADAACALDFDIIGMAPGQQGPFGFGCAFYDIWASHDYNGRNFGKLYPFVSYPESAKAMREGTPFQVFACWSGMVVFKADLFTKEGLLYRRNRPQLGECPVAETETIFHDMWQIGRSKIVIAPNVHTAYGQHEYNTCVRGNQKAITTDATVTYIVEVPPQFSCCPIHEGATFVNFGECRMEPWHDPYAKDGIPRRPGFPHASRRMLRRRLQEVPSPSAGAADTARVPWPEGTRARMLPFSMEQMRQPEMNSTAHGLDLIV